MSEVKVNKISPRSGTAITLGDSGDTFTIPSGATLAIAGSVTGFTSAGIDDNATSVAITIDSSEQVGIGTTSPASLLDVQGTGVVAAFKSTNNNTVLRLKGSNATNGGGLGSTSSGDLIFLENLSEGMRLTSTGLGIGTTSPSTTLHIKSNTPILTFEETDQSNRQFQIGSFGNAYAINDATNSQFRYILDNSGNHVFNEGGADCDFRVESDANTHALFIEGSSGNIGIGTSSPAATLHVDASGGASVQISRTSQGALYLESDGTNGNIRSTSSTGSLAFQTNGNNERARIDSSGNFMVGKTASNYSSPGVEAKSNGNLIAVRDSGNVVNFIRNSNDGSIVTFSKDTTNFASIGVNGDNLVIDGLATDHSGLDFANDKIFARRNSSASDNGVDLGYSGGRFKDIYLGGGAFIGGTGTANKLDDYEEGNWTPGVTFGGGNTGVSSGASTGSYTKVGRIVYVSALLLLGSKGSSTGNALLTGLPFTAGNGNKMNGAVSFAYIERISFNEVLTGSVTSGGTTVSLYEAVSGNVSPNTITNSDFNNSTALRFNITYQTD